jgi:mannose-6-phosphate isomerase-like protein (cupin superfamily)
LKRDRLAAAPYETIAVGDHTVRFLVHAAESRESVSVFEARFPPQTGMPAAHSHDAFDETYYGVAGTMTVTVDGETVALSAGEAVFVSRGAVHEFFNHGSRDARILVIASPGPAGAEDYIRELAALLGAAGDRGPDRVMLEAAMRRHGYVPAPSSRT